MKKNLNLFLLCLLLSGCATYYHVRVNGYLDTAKSQTPIPAAATFFVLENKNARNPIFESQIKSRIEKLLQQKGYRLNPKETADFYLSFIYVMGSGRTVTDVRPQYSPGETEAIRTYDSKGEVRTAIVTFPGYTTYVPYQYTVYTAVLTLEVIDGALVRNSKEEEKIWIGESSTTVQNPDQREIVNYLLVAAFDHFGENTQKSIAAKLKENDPKVIAILQ
jgi:hypothetical protein